MIVINPFFCLMFKGGTCNKIGLKEPPDELLVRGDHVILISLESDLPEVGHDTPLDWLSTCFPFTNSHQRACWMSLACSFCVFFKFKRIHDQWRTSWPERCDSLTKSILWKHKWTILKMVRTLPMTQRRTCWPLESGNLCDREGLAKARPAKVCKSYEYASCRQGSFTLP